MANSTIPYEKLVQFGEPSGSASVYDVPGLYYSAGGVDNLPSGVASAGYVIHMQRMDKTLRKQLYSPYNSDGLYCRTYRNGAWGSWVKVGGGNTKVFTPCVVAQVAA